MLEAIAIIYLIGLVPAAVLFCILCKKVVEHLPTKQTDYKQAAILTVGWPVVLIVALAKAVLRLRRK